MFWSFIFLRSVLHRNALQFSLLFFILRPWGLWVGRLSPKFTLLPRGSLQFCGRLLSAFVLPGFLFRGPQAKLLIDVGENAFAHLLVLLKELLGVFPTLSQPFVPVGKPGARFLYHAVIDPYI